MAQPEAQEVVQAFALDRSDPRLGERVRIGRDLGRLNAPNPGASKQAVEAERVFTVAISDEVGGREILVVQPHEQISALMLRSARSSPRR